MTASSFVNILDYGAIGDETTLNTRAIQAAVDAAAQGGGGTVFIPAGRFLTGPIMLRSNITLCLDAGAVVLGSPSPADYSVVEGRWEGLDQKTYAPLIGGDDLINVTINGRGTIDGQGSVWWNLHRQKKLAHPRPQLIRFMRCSNVLVEGITALNSPSWTINPVRCENLTVDKVTIINPPDSPNTDGINPDSCRNMRISNCYISVGDDCITIKSGKESEGGGRSHLLPSENITIANCTMAHGHGGVVIGSEMSGSVRRVVITNCVFTGTDRGIRMKSRRGRGGVVEDIRVSNIIMDNVLCPLTMNLYYACGAWGNKVNSDKRPHPVTEKTPCFRNIHINGITARNVTVTAAYLYGLAEMPLENITLQDVDISMALDAEGGFPEMADEMEPMRRAGFFIRNIRGLALRHIRIEHQIGPAVRLADAREVDISHFTAATPDAITSAFHFENVTDARIEGCRIPPGSPALLEVGGKASRHIHLANNNLAQGSDLVRLIGEAAADAVID